MKPVSGSYATDILRARRHSQADLFIFTLKDGTLDYFTSLDFNLNYGGNIYKGNSLLIEGLGSKLSVGWTVDEQDVKIIFRPEDTLGGSNFIEGVINGLLDGAFISRKTGFWKWQGGVSIYDYTYNPVDVITRFTGYVGKIDKIGQTFVELKVRSMLGLLDIDMPRNTYQPGCQWSLFDVGCTLNRDDFAYNGTVNTASSTGVTISSTFPTSTGADGLPYYQFGRIKFTSGARNNLSVNIRTNNTNSVTYMYPPIVDVVPGDTFTLWPGCSKTLETCDLKFSNKPQHRGFTKVPPVMISA